MISSCKMKYKSNLPFILCVVLADCIGPAGHAVARRNETPSTVVLTLSFRLEHFQNLGRVHRCQMSPRPCWRDTDNSTPQAVLRWQVKK